MHSISVGAIFEYQIKRTENMTTSITESKKIIGFTDSVNECECCGKSGLKGTFCVEIDGVEFYYGSTCAFKKHGFEKSEVDKSIRKYNERLKCCQITAAKQMRKEYGFGNYTEEMWEKRVKDIMAELIKFRGI